MPSTPEQKKQAVKKVVKEVMRKAEEANGGPLTTQPEILKEDNK